MYYVVCDCVDPENTHARTHALITPIKGAIIDREEQFFLLPKKKKNFVWGKRV